MFCRLRVRARRHPVWGAVGCTAMLLAMAAITVVAAVAGGRAATWWTGPYPDQARPGPVLLVPGYGARKGALNVLAERLRADGRRAAIVATGTGTGDLVAQARSLDTAANAAIAAGAPSVDVIGYSAGGVVVKIWVDRFGGAGKARRIITLGSPLHGATIAGFAALLAPADLCPAACKQLAPFSDLLRGLNARRIPARLPWLSIWSTNDETVTPPDSARLSGAVNVIAQTVCPDARISHSSLPTDPLVDGIILADLGATAALAAPGPGDCEMLRTLGASAVPPEIGRPK